MCFDRLIESTFTITLEIQEKGHSVVLKEPVVVSQSLEDELEFLGVVLGEREQQVFVVPAHDGVEDSFKLDFFMNSCEVEATLDEAVFVDQILPEVEVNTVNKSHVWEAVELESVPMNDVRLVEKYREVHFFVPVCQAFINLNVAFRFLVAPCQSNLQLMQAIDLIVLFNNMPFPVTRRAGPDQSGTTFLNGDPAIPGSYLGEDVLLEVDVDDLFIFIQVVDDNIAVALDDHQIVVQRSNSACFRDRDGFVVPGCLVA